MIVMLCLCGSSVLLIGLYGVPNIQKADHQTVSIGVFVLCLNIVPIMFLGMERDLSDNTSQRSLT